MEARCSNCERLAYCNNLKNKQEKKPCEDYKVSKCWAKAFESKEA